jgi:hypothetical protein
VDGGDAMAIAAGGGGNGGSAGGLQLATRAPGKPSLSRDKNNRYTTTHKFVGITRRAPGDQRSNAARPWR